MIKTMAKNDQTMRKPNDQINEHLKKQIPKKQKVQAVMNPY